MLVLLNTFYPRYAPARNNRKAHLLSSVQSVFNAISKFHIKISLIFRKTFMLIKQPILAIFCKIIYLLPILACKYFYL